MVRCAMRRRVSRIPCIKQIPSFRRSGHGRARIASDSRRDRRRACCRRRAPRHHNSRSSPAFNSRTCRNNNPASLRHIPISSQMDPRTRRHRPSWPTKCDRGACRKESRRPHRTHSPLRRNNFLSRLQSPPTTVARHSRLCNKTTSKTSIRSMRQVNRQRGRLLERMRWSAR